MRNFIFMVCSFVGLLSCTNAMSSDQVHVRCDIYEGLRDNDVSRLVMELARIKSDYKILSYNGGGGDVRNHLILSQFLELNRNKFLVFPVTESYSAANALMPRLNQRTFVFGTNFLFHEARATSEEAIELKHGDPQNEYKFTESLLWRKNEITHLTSLMQAIALHGYTDSLNGALVIRRFLEDKKMDTIEYIKGMSGGYFRIVPSLYGFEINYRCKGF